VEKKHLSFDFVGLTVSCSSATSWPAPGRTNRTAAASPCPTKPESWNDQTVKLLLC
jgi:hypothetical protein